MSTPEPRPPLAPHEVMAWLESLTPGRVRLGLERVERVLLALGSPHLDLPAVTIAGTNGKGSTAAFLASVAEHAGYRVGVYTSPHLVDVSERIRIAGPGGGCIDRSALAAAATLVREAMAATETRLTYFEALTAIALLWFRERDVELAVLEVGMGGRLDATAVVPSLVSVLTPIGLDHERFLGSSLEAIATEKAGILRRGSTLVCDVGDHLFRTVVGPRAFDLRCPIRRAGVDFLPQWLHGGFRYRGWLHRIGPVELGLPGLHQCTNAALACAAAESLMAHGFRFKAVHVAEGLRCARHPGRLEIRPAHRDDRGLPWPTVVLDGAHNALGARILAPQLPLFVPGRPRVLVFSAREDKDLRGLLAPLAAEVDAIVVTALPGQGPPPFNAFAELAHAGLGGHGPRVELEPHIPSALDRARRLAGPAGGIVVADSLYLVGAVLPLLPPPAPGSLDTPRGRR